MALARRIARDKILTILSELGFGVERSRSPVCCDVEENQLLQPRQKEKIGLYRSRFE